MRRIVCVSSGRENGKARGRKGRRVQKVHQFPVIIASPLELITEGQDQLLLCAEHFFVVDSKGCRGGNRGWRRGRIGC